LSHQKKTKKKTKENFNVKYIIIYSLYILIERTLSTIELRILMILKLYNILNI